MCFSINTPAVCRPRTHPCHNEDMGVMTKFQAPLVYLFILGCKWLMHGPLQQLLCLAVTSRCINCQSFEPFLKHIFSVRHRLHCNLIKDYVNSYNKKAQLSLTNPRDAKACQKLLQFDVLTTLSLTILAYLHVFTCCCVRNLRNPEKFTENSNLWSSRSSILVPIESPYVTCY